MLPTLQKFREANGLADIKSTTDISGPEGEMLNDLAELLRNNADKFRRVFNKLLHSGELSQDEENDLKKLMGIMINLKEKPRESGKKLRDPLDNVVVRPVQGSESGSGLSGGEQ